MSVAPHHRVLEIGCGPGYFSPALVRAAFAGMVVLFDLQEEMLRMAADTVGENEVSKAVQGDALALPFASSSFDRVLTVTLLGETGDPVACLREVHRVLRPDGRLVNVEQRGDTDRINPAAIAQLAAESGLTLTRQRSGRLFLSHYAELAA
jgi:ubiquinone/menaquinone biosynthesis C-methylase UbiE